MQIEVDPAELLPGDIVISVRDHAITSYDIDIIVTVERKEWRDPGWMPHLRIWSETKHLGTED